VSFATITLCITSQRVIAKVSVHFVIDSVRKLSGTASHLNMIQEGMWSISQAGEQESKRANEQINFTHKLMELWVQCAVD
jgi:hypothetical protein